MLPICQLFYISKASVEYDDAAVQSILQISRRNNSRLDVTGCLLFSGHYFAQVLEGSEPAVVALAQRISADLRHTRVQVLMQTHQTERAYADWSMGYLHDLGLEDELEALFLAVAPDPVALAAVMARMRPDTVMGALS